MTMKLNCKLLLIAAALALMLPARGQTYERTRDVNKSFAVRPNTEVQIFNKYGNVHVIQWEKDSVKFEIHLLVKGSKQSKIQKNFDMIEFDFTATDHFVIGQTTFSSSKGAFWDEVSDLTNTIFSGSNRTQIDYKVYIPDGCPLKIENKFGNIYLDDIQSKADIVISNGDLKANKFDADLKLEIDFGSVSIRSVKDAEIKAGYAEIEIRKADKLEIDSKSSTFDLPVVQEMIIESRRDKFNIEEIGIIKGNLSFSDLKVEYFSELSILTSNYGSLDFRSVSETFRQVKIDAKYTDLDLNFAASAAFELELVHNDKTMISLPLSAEAVQKESDPDKPGIFRTSGVIGKGSKLPKVDITIESGHVFITNY
ncbi:MAG: hypothetical protein K9H16_12175 [Bacteroidales bacterium]|nr:hypothetical protein [Bacteroidales bacterium]